MAMRWCLITLIGSMDLLARVSLNCQYTIVIVKLTRLEVLCFGGALFFALVDDGN